MSTVLSIVPVCPMDSKSSKADVESRLHQTAEAMSERLASIQDEVSSTGGALRTWIVKNPVKSVGGMLAAGVAVGLVFGGGSSRRRRKKHAQLVDTYLDALRQEVETAVDHGDEPGPALEKALRDRVPLVVYRSERGGGTSGSWMKSLIQETGEIVFSTGMSLLAREVIESLLDTLDIEDIIDEELPDGGE
jgi:ElaB/YqjD/DUF883 family membrane-anchored ribosome-binding protein